MENGITVFTAGTFDLFHIGHLNILRKSKELGSKLIVAVSTDELVKSYKTNGPIIPFTERAEIIKHCDYVDEVVPQDVLMDPELLKKHKVGIVTIGDDWKNKTLPGLEWAKENNIQVVYFPYTKETSSTKIKRNIKNGWQQDK
jgi:glycerol-3-phosphate cytidylyltransferase